MPPHKLTSAEKRLVRRSRKHEKAKNDSFAAMRHELAPAHDDDETILISFRDLVSDPHFGFKSSTMNDQARKDLLSQIHKITRLDWIQWQGRDKHDGGPEPLPKSSIRAQLPPCITEDVKNLVVARFNGQDKRIVGYRQDRTLFIVWIDSDHSLYDHGN